MNTALTLLQAITEFGHLFTGSGVKICNNTICTVVDEYVYVIRSFFTDSKICRLYSLENNKMISDFKDTLLNGRFCQRSVKSV